MIAGNQNPTAQTPSQQSLGRWSNESNNMQHHWKQKKCSIAQHLFYKHFWSPANFMQHDTTTYNKVVKRYKLFLHNKCCTLLYEKLGSFDRGLTWTSLGSSLLPYLRGKASKFDWFKKSQKVPIYQQTMAHYGLLSFRHTNMLWHTKGKFRYTKQSCVF